MGPANPCLTRLGRLPQWSIWAWLSRTASMSLGRKGKCRLRWSLSARWPWKSPQSRSRDWPQASTWCIEPVTVRVAPQNVTVGSVRGFRDLAMRLLFPEQQIDDPATPDMVAGLTTVIENLL